MAKVSEKYVLLHADLTGKRAQKAEDKELSKEFARIFKESRNNYGTRKIKKELAKLPELKQVSRRRIGRLMNEMGLVSTYTVAQFKPHKSMCNEAPVKKELQRQFKQDEHLAVIVSDLTYVRVRKKWYYVCLFFDIFNREIIGHSAGTNKTADLVYQEIASIQANLNDIKMFHTDRGKEFDNILISNRLRPSSTISNILGGERALPTWLPIFISSIKVSILLLFNKRAISPISPISLFILFSFIFYTF